MSHQLKQSYPSLIFLESEVIPPGYEAFYDQGRIFAILKSEIQGKEMMLLRKLYPFTETTPWMSYLLHDGTPLVSTKTFNILQIRLNNTDHADLWLSTFLEFFSNVEDFFSLNELHHVCVLETDALEGMDFDGILQTLQEDIGVNASLYIGDGNIISEAMQKGFKEDLKIFGDIELKHRVNSFKDLYLPYYIASQFQKSYQLQNVRQRIYSLKEGMELVEVLWSCQGNITQAAQLLFLHRNTLNYRLDKFEDHTGLSLRELGDLQLAYFSII